MRTPTFVRAATALSRPPLPAAVRAAFAAPYARRDRRRAVGDFVADIPLEPGHPSRPALDASADGVARRSTCRPCCCGVRATRSSPAYLATCSSGCRTRRCTATRARPTSCSRTRRSTPRRSPWVAELDASRPPDAPRRTRRRRRGRRCGPRSTERAGATRRPRSSRSAAARPVSWSLLARRVREIAAGLVATGVRARRPGRAAGAAAAPNSPRRSTPAGGSAPSSSSPTRGSGCAGMGRALRGARVDHVIGIGAGLAAARPCGCCRRTAGHADRRRLRAAPASCARSGPTTRSADLARLGREARSLPPTPGPDDECAVVFTSGATGPAKGVAYRHRQVQAQLELHPHRRTRSLPTTGSSPRSRRSRSTARRSASARPCPTWTSPRPATLTAAALADAVAAIGATVVFASPARAAQRGRDRRGARPRPARAPWPPVRLVHVGGRARAGRACCARCWRCCPAAEAHTPYGMTEALPVTDVSLAEIEAAGAGDGVCVGRPLRRRRRRGQPAVGPLGVADGALTTEPGVTGEVCVRAEHVKDRYDALWATERASSPGRRLAPHRRRRAPRRRRAAVGRGAARCTS